MDDALSASRDRLRHTTTSQVIYAEPEVTPATLAMAMASVEPGSCVEVVKEAASLIQRGMGKLSSNARPNTPAGCEESAIADVAAGMMMVSWPSSS